MFLFYKHQNDSEKICKFQLKEEEEEEERFSNMQIYENIDQSKVS